MSRLHKFAFRCLRCATSGHGIVFADDVCWWIQSPFGSRTEIGVFSIDSVGFRQWEHATVTLLYISAYHDAIRAF